jgi:hypothetical protein
VAVYPLADLETDGDEGRDLDDTEEASPQTIADVLVIAKRQIAKIAGVLPEQINLHLRIEY